MVNKKIKKVNPKATPKICGNVFFIPKLKPENDATALFGPGVKPRENEIPISKSNSDCIKFKQLVNHSQSLEMDEPK